MSVESSNLAEIRKELSKAKNLGTPINDNLYCHLSEGFNRIMLQHPNDCYDRFETISMLVKKNNFQIRDPKSDHEVNN